MVLQQILISALSRLIRCMGHDMISIYTRLEDGNAKITLTGRITPEERIAAADLVSGIPSSQDVSLEACLDGLQAFVWIEAPSLGRATVLVVDDNEDMARLYRVATARTRYRIVHTAQGHGLSELVQTTAPDVIVLDVMLPDIDGWRVLMHLRQDPATRDIPVIVCSVVREEELALSLGAASYLAKPVRPREFIRALDRVCPPAAAVASTPPENSAAAC
jgi:CheY-like chemotaxis protein